MNITSLETLNEIRNKNIQRDLEFKIEKINEAVEMAAARGKSSVIIDTQFINKVINSLLLKNGYKVVYKSDIPRLPYYEVSWNYKDNNNDDKN